MPPLLDVRGLTLSFPARPPAVTRVDAVRNISFSIAPGEVLGLVGESGSGKSVSSLAIMGLLPPEAHVQGSISLAGQELISAAPDQLRGLRGRTMAMIFQEPMTALNPVMRVGDQVAEAVLAHERVSQREASARAIEALRTVAIPDPDRRARDYPHQLSGGRNS